MANPIGRLLVQVGADTGGLTRGGKRAETTMQGMSRQARRSAKTLAKLGTAATAAGVAITAAMTKRGLEAVDAQAKLGRQIGATQSEVAGLQRAFSDAGIAEGQMRSNLQALNKRLGEAQQGTGQAGDALDALGLSAQELANMPVDKRLDAIGTAVNGLSTQTEKAAVTADLFSRSGLDMMNVFEQGEGAISEAVKEMRMLGVAVSETDASAIERANDAMSRIGDVIQGVSNQLAAQFAPVLEAVSNKIVGMVKEAGGMGNVVEDAFNRGVDVAVFLVNAVDGVKRTFELAGKVVALFGAMVVRNALWAADGIINGPNKALNGLLGLLNKIPGVDIAPVGLSDLGKTIANQYKIANQAVIEAEKDIGGTLTKPLAGERLRAFIEEAKMASEQLAQDATGGGGDNGNGAGPGLSEEDREKMQGKLDAIREANMTEVQLLREKHAMEMEELQRAREQKLVSQQEFNDLMKNTTARHEDEISDIEERAAEARKRTTEQEMKARQAATGGALRNIASLMSSENKKMFEVGKTAAIANSIVNTWQGVTEALKLPWPLNLAAAAATAVQGFAAVSSIRSQSFGGGGGGGSSASSAPSGGSAASAQQGQGGGPEGGTLTVKGLSPSSMFTGDAVGELAEELLDYQRRGGNVVLS